MTEPLPVAFQVSTLLRITEASPPSPAAPRHVIRGDEELLEYGYESRTSPRNETTTINYKCTPSVFRFYKQPIEQQGDFRVDITPMRHALLWVNGGDERKLDYLFNPGTCLFNDKGYPMQMYGTMSGNEVLIDRRQGDWLRITTLTPDDYRAARTMTHETFPWLVHKFDLVCWDRIDKKTYHHSNTPRGTVYYYIVTNEGFAWIHSRYVREV